LELLKYAASLGDKLCVGIDSDVRVSASKGKDRPVNNQTFRKNLLEALVYVDKVYIFDTDYQLSQYIKQLSPHMVIGDDYVGKKVIGAEFAEKVTFFPRIQGFSTTETIKKVKNG
jgi:D-beta-D-heptose 7-phosphate kinase/D-beta-D-heptose 1-phosphate adenosyltransferase